MGMVYIIKNSENDKVYYGSTQRNLAVRMREHKSRARTARKGKDYLLYKEMQMIGIDKFTIHVFKDNLDDGLLKETERMAIKAHEPKESLLNTDQYLTESDWQLICELYKEKTTLKEISKRFNTCKKTLSEGLKQRGIEIRDWNAEQRSPLEVERVKFMYHHMMLTSAEIGAEYGVSSVAVRNFMVKHGIALRKPMRRDLLYGKRPPSQK